MSVNNVCTGWPSNAPKSTGASKKHNVTNAVADCRGFQSFARQQYLQQKIPINFVGQSEHLDYTAKNGWLVLAGQPIENSPHLQGVGQFRKRRGAVFRFLKNPWRNVDAIGRGPFQQFSAIKPILSTEPVTGQFSLINPAINRLFRDIQQPGNIFDGQLHLFAMSNLRNALWTSLDILRPVHTNVKHSLAP
jgi:hypothetical protein